MAKGIYVGVDGNARKVKKAYVGIDGTARKIKKGYIGVGGVARPVFSGRELVYYGSSEDGAVEALSEARYLLSAVTVGKHALFAGGRLKESVNGHRQSEVVDAYDESMIHSVIEPLGYQRQSMGAGANTKYGIFVGGISTSTSGTSYAGRVDFYDQSLTHSEAIYSSSSSTYKKIAKANLISVTLGSVCLFTGGIKEGSTSPSSDVFGWNEDKTFQSISINLGSAPKNASPSAVSVGNVGIFNQCGFVYCCDSSLTVSSLLQGTTLGQNLVGNGVGFTLGNHAVFAAGGRRRSSGSNFYYDAADGDVYAFDESLTETYLPELIRPIYNACATVLGKYALVGYGDTEHLDSISTNAIDVIDESLTKVAEFNIGSRRDRAAAASVGKYAIFAGGIDSSSATPTLLGNEVEVFSI